MKIIACTVLAAAWVVGAHAAFIETQVNQSIPDGDLSGLASTIHLSGLSDPINSLQIELNISGTYTGDLYAYITHAGGFTVLLNRAGRTAQNDLGFGDGGLEVTFSANAPDIHTYRDSLSGNSSAALSGPLTGLWAPDGRSASPLSVLDTDSRTALLSSFQGLDPNGSWTLFVADVNGGDLHELNSWSLEVNVPVTPVPESGNTMGLLLFALSALGFVEWLRRGGYPVELTRQFAMDGMSRCEASEPPGQRRNLIHSRKPGRRLARSRRVKALLAAASVALLTNFSPLQAQPAWFHGFPISPPHQIPNIAAGMEISYGLRTDGTVLAVGDDLAGLIDVSGWRDVIALSAGTLHIVGLKSDGTVLAAGVNWSGECNVSDWSGIVAVAAGGSFTVGLKADGTIVAVGQGYDNATEWTGIVALSAGASYVSGIKADGTVVSTQSGTEAWNHITALATGESYTVALRSDGTVVATGSNTYGESDVNGWSGIIALAAGDGHTVGLKADGTVVAAGANWYGQANVGDWTDIVAIVAGTSGMISPGGHTLGLKEDGTLVATGPNDNHQSEVATWYLGSPPMVPKIVKAPQPQFTFTGGLAHFRVLALGPEPIRYRWFRNGTEVSNDGRIDGATSPALTIHSVQPGDAGAYSVEASNDTGPITSDPVNLTLFQRPAHLPWHRIAAGGSQTLGLKANGTVLAVGSNEQGQCNVEGWSGIVSVAAGESHSVGLNADGTVVAVGNNFSGQCDVNDWSGIVAVSAGWTHTVGLRVDGKVMTAGANDEGERNVEDWTGMVDIAAGQYQTLGLKSDGTVPQTRPGITDTSAWNHVVALAAGVSLDVVGLRSDGTVVANVDFDLGPSGISAWDHILGIALGDAEIVGLKSNGTVLIAGNTAGGRSEVTNWTEIVEVSAGIGHIVGLKADGTLVAAGLNAQHRREIWDWYLGPDGVAPIFTRTPPDETAILGGPFAFGITAAGPGTIHFAWFKDGVRLAEGAHVTGTTTSTIRIAGVQPADEGNYTVAAENEYGETVCSPISLRAIPMPAHQLPNVATALEATLGLKTDGTVLSTGDFPKNWTDIVSLGGWPTGALGVKSDGTVIGTFGFENGPVSDWTAIVAVAGGRFEESRSYSIEHAVGLRADGTVLAIDAASAVPLIGDDNLGEDDVDTWKDIVAVAASDASTFGLKADGTVLATGPNLYGERNIGEWRNIKAIAVGSAHTVGLKTEGTVVAVGWNDPGQCNVGNWKDIVAVAAGYAHTVGLRSDGTVIAVGLNDSGQCNVGNLKDVVAIAAGTSHTVCLKADGTVLAIGGNSNGQLNTSGWNLGAAANRPPLAGTLAIATPRNATVDLALSKLQHICSDPDGDAITIVAVNSASGAGGTAQLNGNNVTYAPPLNFVGTDFFAYTVQDCRGACSQGTVRVTVRASTGNGQNVVGVTAIPGGPATIHFAGIPGFTYQIEASTDLVLWTGIGSATAASNGSIEFVDKDAAGFMRRYYRTRISAASP